MNHEEVRALVAQTAREVADQVRASMKPLADEMMVINKRWPALESTILELLAWRKESERRIMRLESQGLPPASRPGHRRHTDPPPQLDEYLSNTGTYKIPQTDIDRVLGRGVRGIVKHLALHALTAVAGAVGFFLWHMLTSH